MVSPRPPTGGRPPATPPQNPSNSTPKGMNEILDWLGPNASVRHKTRDNRDIIVMSADGTRKFRTDVFYTHGEAPHIHFEILVDGNWIDAFPGVHHIFVRQ